MRQAVAAADRKNFCHVRGSSDVESESAYTVMGYMVMADIFVAYIVVGCGLYCTVMAYIITVYMVTACVDHRIRIGFYKHI